MITAVASARPAQDNALAATRTATGQTDASRTKGPDTATSHLARALLGPTDVVCQDLLNQPRVHGYADQGPCDICAPHATRYR